MRIAFLATFDTGYEHGVLKKVTRQIRAWRKEGHEVKLFALSRCSQHWKGMADLPSEIVTSARSRYHLFRSVKLLKPIMNWQPDIVYLRFSLYYPLFEKIISSIPTCLEINSYHLGDMKSVSKIFWLYHYMTRHRILSKARGMTCVTHEIAKKYCRYPQPKVVISNGIDLTEYYQLPAPQNLSPKLVFIASSNSPWHGIDKIFWMARHFKHWEFNIIGAIGTKDIGREIPSNLVLHGLLGREQYQPLMASADIGIGTLALHRKEMNEACPLKVREYLAYGIPTLIGYRDTDFLEPAPYLLEIKNSVDNVQVEATKIEEFVEFWKGKRVAREEITHLDTSSKERQRIDFIYKIIGRYT